MLKTNSKQARANVRAYILENFTPENYTDTPPQGFPNVAAFILNVFRSEKFPLPQDVQYYRGRELAAFRDWCAGLPSVMDTCYFYNRSAIDDLGAILDETDAEKARYSERDAEQLLTDLIYSELVRGREGK